MRIIIPCIILSLLLSMELGNRFALLVVSELKILRKTRAATSRNEKRQLVLLGERASKKRRVFSGVVYLCIWLGRRGHVQLDVGVQVERNPYIHMYSMYFDVFANQTSLWDSLCTRLTARSVKDRHPSLPLFVGGSKKDCYHPTL